MGDNFWHPTRVVPLAFLAAVTIGTLLLMLPIARAGAGGAPLLVAVFTATSAVCVTGLSVVDTGSYWTPLGQGIIMLLFQLGGLGIMTAATLLGLLISNRLRLGQRLITQTETHLTSLADIGAILRLVLMVTFSVQLVVASFLFAYFQETTDLPAGSAAWQAIFHTGAAFNSAGFSLHAANLTHYALDPFVLFPLAATVLIGGIGFPVLYELRREPMRPQTWSLHTKLTLAGTAALILVGTLAVLAFESRNPDTLGTEPFSKQLVAALFHASASRTAGFNGVDVGTMRDETLLVTMGLMLIGGGSASTAGGIKITTFLILGMVVMAEIQGERDPTSFRRRISGETQRLALTVALLAIAVVALATLAMLSMTGLDLTTAMFEVISAFATNGLSTGITPTLPPSAQLLLVILMFGGRVGTVTLAAALAMHHRPRPYRYPEERPIIG